MLKININERVNLDDLTNFIYNYLDIQEIIVHQYYFSIFIDKKIYYQHKFDLKLLIKKLKESMNLLT